MAQRPLPTETERNEIDHTVKHLRTYSRMNEEPSWEDSANAILDEIDKLHYLHSLIGDRDHAAMNFDCLVIRWCCGCFERVHRT